MTFSYRRSISRVLQTPWRTPSTTRPNSWVTTPAPAVCKYRAASRVSWIPTRASNVPRRVRRIFLRSAITARSWGRIHIPAGSPSSFWRERLLFYIADPWGSNSTEGWGMNSSGDVVGYYTTSAGHFDGSRISTTSIPRWPGAGRPTSRPLRRRRGTRAAPTRFSRTVGHRV